MNKFYSYFVIEFKRCMIYPRFCLALLGCSLVWWFSLQKIHGCERIYDAISYIMYAGNSIIALLYVLMAVPYATGFCEDLETGYIRYILIRGNLKKYVISKIAVIYISAISVTVLAGFGFSLILNSQIPWISGELYDGIGLSGIMEAGNYRLWFFLYFLQWGFWYGALTVIASFFSIFIVNRLLTWIMPALLHQAVVETNVFGLGIFPLFKIPMIFDAQNTSWGNECGEFIWSCLLSLLIVGIMNVCIMRKLQQV